MLDISGFRTGNEFDGQLIRRVAEENCFGDIYIFVVFPQLFMSDFVLLYVAN